MAIAALLYFVSPIDLISDILPGGYADDGVVLALLSKLLEISLPIIRNKSDRSDRSGQVTDRTDYQDCPPRCPRARGDFYPALATALVELVLDSRFIANRP